MQKLVRMAAYAAAGSSILCVAAAQAQGSPAGQGVDSTDGNADGVIVVTAQKREQSLQKVPASISVVSGETLTQRNIANLEQLTTLTSGVRISAQPASDSMHIRGAGSGSDSGFEQSVATFVDGIYRGRSRSSRAALFDLQRVEVLKGPQSTYFGNNAIAGAFNITTRKPGNFFAFNAQSLYVPSNGEYNMEAGIDIPLSGTAEVRFSGRGSGMSGYVYNEHLKRDEPHLRDWIGRMNLVWEINDDVQTNLRIDRIRNRDRGTFFGEILKCPPDPQFGPARGLCAAYLAEAGGIIDDELNFRMARGDSAFRYDATEIAFSNDIKIPDHTLSLTTGYFKQDSLVYSNIVPTPTPGVFGMSETLPAVHIEDFSQFTQEIRLSSREGQRFEYMVGAYYLQGKLTAPVNLGFFFAPFGEIVGNGFPSNSAVVVKFLTHQRERSLSLFGSATYHLTDSLRMNAGIRFSRVHKSGTQAKFAGTADTGGPYFENFVRAPRPAELAVLQFVGYADGDFPIDQRTDKKLIPSVDIQYDLSPEVMLYGSYTNGFKAGGFSNFNSDVFDPEEVDAYETGIKSRLLDRRLTLNLAFFLSDYKNLQEANQILTQNTVITVVGNVAASRSKGVEIYANFDLTDRLSLRADVGYLDAKFTKYPNAPCSSLESFQNASCIRDLSGERRGWAPKWSGSVGASYTMPLSRFYLALQPTVEFSSKYYQQTYADPLFVQPSYAKIDFRAELSDESEGWAVALIGKNLTNRKTASFRKSVPTAPGVVDALTDRGRTIGIQILVRR